MRRFLKPLRRAWWASIAESFRIGAEQTKR